MTEKITVLMPAYNREKYIGQAIWGILNQTHADLELIVYDDGSRDGTKAVVGSYRNHDERVKLIMGAVNHGVGYARNKLLEAVETKFACWQDSDDISNIYRLKMQFETMRKEDKPLCFANYEIYRGDEFVQKVIANDIWQGKPSNSKAIKRGYATAMFDVSQVGQFDETKKLGDEDADWIKNIEEKFGGQAMFPIVPEVLYYIRFHEDRIGAWKRKLVHLKGTNAEINMSYEEMLRSLKW